MGIQSTVNVTREWATNRINQISDLAANKQFSKLEEHTFEPDKEPVLVEPVESVVNWSITMLESQLDKPFYRQSMFENYYVFETLEEIENWD